jgi:hypothetical protein
MAIGWGGLSVTMRMSECNLSRHCSSILATTLQMGFILTGLVFLSPGIDKGYLPHNNWAAILQCPNWGCRRNKSVLSGS